jgi:quercetin 2,3-dioxygenase
MITVRKSENRGHLDHGWLDTYHTFSFDQYYDPRWMGFHSLRVINEDRVAPRRGFPTHSHRDMEIITYILAGSLEHKDSMGNGSVIRRGDVQRMTAGNGVSHSEANPGNEFVHLLQIWVLPNARGLTPSYEQKAFSDEDKRGRLCLVASETGHEGSVTINQDANVYASILEPGEHVAHQLGSGRHVWLQVARGHITLNGQAMRQGDGASASNELELKIVGDQEPAEILLFDMS